MALVHHVPTFYCIFFGHNDGIEISRRNILGGYLRVIRECNARHIKTSLDELIEETLWITDTGNCLDLASSEVSQRFFGFTGDASHAVTAQRKYTDTICVGQVRPSITTSPSPSAIASTGSPLT